MLDEEVIYEAHLAATTRPSATSAILSSWCRRRRGKRASAGRGARVLADAPITFFAARVGWPKNAGAALIGERRVGVDLVPSEILIFLFHYVIHGCFPFTGGLRLFDAARSSATRRGVSGESFAVDSLFDHVAKRGEVRSHRPQPVVVVRDSAQLAGVSG